MSSSSSTMLWKQHLHRSNETHLMTTSDQLIQSYYHSMPKPDPRIENLLEVAGFAEVAKIRHFKIDDSLITSLVERWRPKTHTFHFPVGECTVTLEDVALQLGLRIDGKPVTGPTFFDWDELCYELLGFVPPKGEALVGSTIKLKWLRDHTIALPDEPTQQQLLQHCRAYILGLIGGVIMPDKSGNRIHLMYLPLLADLERAGRYSWGSACLAHLYRELCRAIYPSSKKMGGCSLLLQSWAWYRMPSIQPRVQQDITFPLASRWSGRGLRFSGTPHGDLLGYRLRYDNMNHNEFLWMPYREFQSSLPPRAYKNSRIWTACTALTSFAVVVWHQTDRVQLQFGLWQPIPNEAHNLDKMHDIDMRGHSDTNWAQQHADWISIWKDRRKHVIFGEPLQGPLQHTPEYLQWFRANSKLFLCSQYSSSHASTSSTQLPTTTATTFPMAGDNHPPYSVEQHPQSYPSFHTHHEQFMYTPPSTTPTGDFMSNLFGVDAHTPQNAYNYMQSMNFPSFSSYHSEVGGSGSSNPVTDTVNIEHDEDQVEPQQPRIGRRNPTRNRQPPRCGTGGHRHH